MLPEIKVNVIIVNSSSWNIHIGFGEKAEKLCNERGSQESLNNIYKKEIFLLFVLPVTVTCCSQNEDLLRCVQKQKKLNLQVALA